jgi:hypothetical protein
VAQGERKEKTAMAKVNPVQIEKFLKSLFEKCSKYIFAAALEADLSDFSNSL